MQSILKEISELTKLKIGEMVAHDTIFDDNKGCVELLKFPKTNPRTRYISIKWEQLQKQKHLVVGNQKTIWVGTSIMMVSS
jgi:hypothetical protein